MYRKLLLLFMASLVTTAGLFAQGTIRGTVTDAETGETLPGVNVIITQLNTGDATDVEGNYEITDVPAGTYTLTATFVGFQRFTAEVEVGNSVLNYDIEMQVEVLGLGDAVVTAFGIERERRALGYGVSEVSGEEIENRQQPDVARALSGQMPGVDISAAGGVTGSGTDIVIRGMTTLTGSNSPLVVVDGVRFDNGRNSQGSFLNGGGSQATPNRMIDLDPKNIADVSVLKGLSATVLYGEEGRNGVILITTKSGSFSDAQAAQSGFQITYDQSVYATQISSRPDYQDTYGGGFDQQFGWFFSNWGPRFDETDPSIFGNFFLGYDDDGQVLVTHPLLNHGPTAAAFPELQNEPYRYEAKPDPIEAFFRTGMASTSSLNIAGGNQDLSVNVNFSRSAEEGFTPNNELTRNAFALGAQYKINERFFANTTFNMSLTDMQTPPISAGYGSGTYGTQSVFGDVFYTPRNIDLDIPYQNPVTGGSAYYRSGNDIAHPRWTANNALTTNDSKRYYGKTEFNYSVTDEINVIYRVGYDQYVENSSYRQNPGGVAPDDFLQGYYQTREVQRTSWDQSVNALMNYQLTEDFNLDGTVGAQYVTERRESDGIASLNMVIFDFWRHSNFLNQSGSSSLGGNMQSTVERQTAGVFGTFTLGYQDFVYLNVAGRNDWFSTLEPENRSIFYPSASLSYIMSDHLDITNDFLTYVKLFAGVGTSAGSPGPYNTRSSLATNVRGFVTQDGDVITRNATSSFLGNSQLKPELHTEYELGVDLRFLEGKLGLEANAYHRSTTDLITSAPIDPGTGYTSTLINVGEIENQGLELTLRASPLGARQPLGWDMQANFFASRSEVISLGTDLDQIAIAGFTDQGNYAIPGEPFMVMYGTKIVRDENGTPVTDGTGNYIQDPDLGIIGDPNPDWTLSFSNTLRYKGASLSFQLDYQQGGDMFSTWISTLFARGLTTDTEAVDRNNTFVLPGVNENGDPNNVQISPSDVFFNNFGFGPAELAVYDMTHIRLANVSLSYDLPAAIIERSPFSQVTLSLTGDNLWMFAFNVPEGSGFDPSVNSIGGNSRGFEYLTGPASRRFGGSLRVRF